MIKSLLIFTRSLLLDKKRKVLSTDRGKFFSKCKRKVLVYMDRRRLSWQIKTLFLSERGEVTSR